MDQAKLFLSSFGGVDPDPSDPGDPISQSLRFRGAQNLKRSFASGVSDTKTVSFWMKKDVDSTSITHLFTGGSLWSVELDTAAGDYGNPNGIGIYDGTGHDMGKGSYRDPSAWYHVVSTTVSTSARIWVNGELMYEGGRNQVLFSDITIGSYYDDTFYFDGYLADVYFIDGQALDPTTFGRYNANDIWVPVRPQGLTFGSNGFYLDFSDPNDIGADRSPNSNDFTATGFSTVPAANYAWSQAGSETIWSYPDESIGLNAPFESLTDNYIYLSPGGVNTMTFTFESPIPVTGSLDVIMMGGSTASGYGSNTLTINYADGTSTNTSFLDSGSSSLVSVDLPVTGFGDAITSLVLANPNAGGINGGFAGLKIDGQKLLLSTTASDSDYDWMLDSPTQNFATFNPLYKQDGDIAEGYLQYTAPVTDGVTGTTFSFNTSNSESWYVEFRHNLQNRSALGVASSDGRYFDLLDPRTQNTPCIVYDSNGPIWINGSEQSPSQSAWNAGSTISMRFDSTTRNLIFANDGIDQTGVTATLPEDSECTIICGDMTGVGGGSIFNLNAGQQPFIYPVPEGFKAIQTQNLLKSTIINGRDHFQAITGPGTGATGLHGDWTNAITIGDQNYWYSEGPSSIFDGSTSTNAGCADNRSGGDPGAQFSFIYFNPVGGIDFTDNVEVWTHPTTTSNFTFNGGAEVTAPAGQWVEIASGGGTINNITCINSIPNNSTAWWSGIKVDGQLLIDNGQLGGDWSKDVYGSASTTYNPNETAKGWLGPPEASFTYGPWRMFDGDLTDKACKTGTGNAQTWIYWRPEPAIENVTQLTVHTSNAQTVRINGGAPTGQTSSNTAASYPIEIANPPSTLTEIAIQGNSISSATVMGITINNKVLIEDSILTEAQKTFPQGLYWIKDRTGDNSHQFVDTLRGTDTAIFTPSTLNVMIDNSYEPPTGDSVAWCWSAPEDFTPTGSNGITNLSGKRNVEAGFSMVTGATDGTSGATFTHGLDQAPEFIIGKNRTNAYNWCVYHKDLTDAPNTFYTSYLNSNGAEFSNGSLMWDVSNAGQVRLGSNVGINRAGDTCIYWMWHSVPGYSAMGSYFGNGVAGGRFVFCGFKPAWVMCKAINVGNQYVNWFVNDSTRSPNNPNGNALQPNLVGEELNNTSSVVDLLSNGFQVRGGGDQYNQNNAKYMYVAFAENPFELPVTAR